MVVPNGYDVLFLDENMTPRGLKGTGATRRLRAAGVTGIIVGLTGSASEEHNAMAKDAGQDHVLGKPFSDTKALATLLRRLSEKGGRIEVVNDADGETGGAAAYPKYDPSDPVQPWTDEDTRPSELPCVDEAFQRRVYTDMTGTDLGELVAMFTAQLNSTCTAAETAATPEHRQRLHHLTHDLKGVAGTLGYIAIQRAAYDLTEATRGSGDVDPAALASRLVAERDRFRRHYRVDDD